MLSCVGPRLTNPLARDLVAFGANFRVVLRAEARMNFRRGTMVLDVDNEPVPALVQRGSPTTRGR